MSKLAEIHRRSSMERAGERKKEIIIIVKIIQKHSGYDIEEMIDSSKSLAQHTRASERSFFFRGSIKKY
jgi:hypothetical protein